MAWWDENHGGDAFHEVNIRPGVKFRLYFDSDLCRMIYSGGFEENELAFVEAFLRPGDVFLDVGANIGLFSVIAGRIIGPTGRIFAFEPVKKTYARLTDNLQINGYGTARCENLALSSADGEVEMVVSVGDKDAWNSMARPYVEGEFRTEKVAVTTWDNYATQNDLAGKAALMKIDVEGWEHHVLAGGRASLARPDAPVLQVEFTEKAAVAASSSTNYLYRSIRELGYSLHRFNPDSRTLEPEPERPAWNYCNLFAIKDIASVEKRIASR